MNAISPDVPSLNAVGELRKSLSCFPTGVAIVTTVGRDGTPIGLTISSFNSVSMTPPLILWSLALSAGSLPEFRAHPAFAINILSAGQEELCKIFSTPVGQRFEGIEWSTGYEGIPVLANCCAVFECRTFRTYEGGDHEIILGEVHAHHNTDMPPLVYGKGKFGEFSAS